LFQFILVAALLALLASAIAAPQYALAPLSYGYYGSYAYPYSYGTYYYR
jgi:hypothetical protein